ncbi:AAA family ATPase [Amycolatopsis lurida]
MKCKLPGRRAECERIGGLLSDIAAGAGGGLVLHGETGIGKSALVRFAGTEAADFTVLRITGHAAESAVPFAALHHLLQQLSGETSRLARTLEEGAHDGLALPAEVLRSLRQTARQRPVLCAVDDAHQVDESSLRVLSFVARRVGSDRIGMLFAYNDESCDGGPLAGLPAHRLLPLDQQASREVLAATVPLPEVRAALAESAMGNPLALTELAASLTPAQLRGELPVPRTPPPSGRLCRAYRARLDRLPAATRSLVLLATADDPSDVDTLVRAAASREVDIAALEPAESAGLIRVEGTTVVFSPPLLRSVVYHGATLAQRRAAHRCLAEALAPGTLRQVLHRAATATGPDEELAAELARAAAEPVRSFATASQALERAADLAADADTAAIRLVAAARHAWHAGEPSRARLLLRRVVPVDVRAKSKVLAGEIELRVGAAGTARRTLLAAADELADRDRHLALAAFIRAGEALCLSGRYSRYPELARRALALRRPDEPPAVEAMFDHLATLSATFRGAHSLAVDPSRRLLALAPTLDDADTLTRTSTAAIFRGDEARALELATRAIRVARADGDASALPQAMEAATLAEFALGRFDNPATGLDGLRLARESGQDNLAGNYLALLAAIAAMTGDRRTCLVRLRAASSRLSGHGIGRAEAFRTWALAALALADGQYADVVARLRGTTTGNGHLIVGVAATPHLVEAAVRCGQRTIAAEALEVYDAWARSTGSPHWLALSSRCHALLADNAGEAEERYREALARHGTGAFELARTELLFGEHLRRRRKPKAAREFLQSALTTFERFAARPWAARATVELRAAGEPVRPRRTRPGQALTPHQAQIARLVADGATNKEVAVRMAISTRTVDHHLRNIFAKLGVRSRVELSKAMR